MKAGQHCGPGCACRRTECQNKSTSSEGIANTHKISNYTRYHRPDNTERDRSRGEVERGREREEREVEREREGRKKRERKKEGRGRAKFSFTIPIASGKEGQDMFDEMLFL